jgi:hypothetical protein
VTDRQISNSEINKWKRCRRAWYLTYYLELGHEEGKFLPVGPTWLGTVLHDALEALYGHGEDPIRTLFDIYDYLERSSPAEEGSESLEMIRKDRELAHIMLLGYLQWIEEEGVDSQIEITGAEETVAIQLSNGYTLTGKLDVRGVNTQNRFKFFLDHKTVGDLVTPKKTMDINEQFPTYALLDRMTKEASEHVDGGYVNMLKRVKRTTRAKPPFYARVDIKFNRHQLNSMWQRINSVANEIEATRQLLDSGRDHRYTVYPSPTKDCEWDCAFRAICPMMDDGSRWSEALHNDFVKIDPYARYKEIPLRVKARKGAAAEIVSG